MNKKDAKHAAAQKVITKLSRRSSDDEDDDQPCGNNNIIDLLDYCVLRNYPKPEFECISQCGPSHAPLFTFECRLSSIKRSATARSKQLAKQLSAKVVLDIVRTVRKVFDDNETVFNNLIYFRLILTLRRSLLWSMALRQQRNTFASRSRPIWS